MSLRDQPVKIVRSTAPDGRTLGFTTTGGGMTGRAQLQSFRADQVPDFEGNVAFFAVERVRNSMRVAKVVRQVEPPPGETVEPSPVYPPGRWPTT